MVIIFFPHLKVDNFNLELRRKTYAVRVGCAVVCDRHIPVAVTEAVNDDLSGKAGFVSK